MNCYFGCREDDEDKIELSNEAPSITYSAEAPMEIFVEFKHTLCVDHYKLVQQILNGCSIYVEDSDNCRGCW